MIRGRDSGVASPRNARLSDPSPIDTLGAPFDVSAGTPPMISPHCEATTGLHSTNVAILAGGTATHSFQRT